ncbi:hypothetical protein [Rubinisphaera margarita]|uniref:hypothetical protein n=1 Tax=Rubinisphaera margarita TaxID=2909586 RepID=UPI001EE974CA|nr:hypothetical protein [Rubinisphaera margarita]MCG6156496.1 hypothetical protein [Rubinisphaera margarita]
MHHSSSSTLSRRFVLQIGMIFCATLFFFVDHSSAETPKAFVLQEQGDLKWYRGNLHTHSHWSDGDDYLGNIALWYRDNGYHFLSFTDHNVLAQGVRWVDVEKTKGGQTAFDKLLKNFPDQIETREEEGVLQVRLRTFGEVERRFNKPGEFLLIQGEEISDKYDRYPIHMNASNVGELITPRGGASVAETIQNNVNAVMTQRERTGQSTLIHLNHPNFGFAVTAEDLMRVVGEKFFEVYNGHPSVYNAGNDTHSSTERMWDIILTRRIDEFELPLMYGIAVDDGHNYHRIPSRQAEPGRGWVVVLADELSAETLVQALEAGKFYASSGVALKRIAVDGKQMNVEVEPVEGETYTIEFIGTRQGYDPRSEPVVDENGEPVRATRRYSDDIGQILQSSEGTSAAYTFQGDEIYVRARITSSAVHPNPSEVGDKKQAWIQPVVVNGSDSE